MAFQPSKRSSQTFEPLEVNVLPMMNLMVVLIPLLLSTATSIKLGVIELNLPQAIGGPATTADVPTEVERSLDLTVSITSEGFYISSAGAILQGTEAQGPTIPKTAEGEYDYEALSKKLFEVKQRIVARNQDTKKIILQAEADIGYQILVSTMDASRSITIDAVSSELFPVVSISAGVI